MCVCLHGAAWLLSETHFVFIVFSWLRVGHLLAERKIQTAKVVAKAGIGAGACTLCVAVALVYTNAARDFWTDLFTPTEQQPGAEQETVSGMLADIHDIWPLVMLFLIVDGLYALNGGLMRGLGLQGSLVMCAIHYNYKRKLCLKVQA